MTPAAEPKPHEVRTESDLLLSKQHHELNDIKTFPFSGQAFGQGAGV